MEYAESPKRTLDKMVTNETLAKMTRSSHFNPKSGATLNGFRSPPALPSHVNGKTISSGNRCSTLEQPRRSVITLKNAPGPPVNSSGTGVLKTKSGILSMEGKTRNRSRKRSREGEAFEVSNQEEGKKDGADHSTSASENVEPARRRRRGQGSKRPDNRKNGQLPPVADSSFPKLKASNSTGLIGILDLYGLKSKAVDVTRFMVDTPLDKLLSESLDKSGASTMESETGEDGECKLVIDEINNVMQLLPKHTFVQKPFVENAQNEDVKVRLMLDLERPLQPEDSQQVDDGKIQRTSSFDKAKSKSLELFPTFTLDDLPLQAVDEFTERLKLPPNESLETLIAYSKPTDHVGPPTEKTSRYEGIPPSPFSFWVRSDVDYGRAPRNGRTVERSWSLKAHTGEKQTSKARTEQSIVKTEPSEPPEDRKGETRHLIIKPKAEPPDTRNSTLREQQEHSGLQVKIDEDDLHRSNVPTMPYSPGVQAATILCNMANSDEKKLTGKGKRTNEDPPTQRVSKLARVDDKPNSDNIKKEASNTPVKKTPVIEKRKSLTQVNHSLNKRSSPSQLDSARNQVLKPEKAGSKPKEVVSGKPNGILGFQGKSGNGVGIVKSPKVTPAVTKKETLTVSKSRCFVSSEPVGSVVGPRTTVSIKSTPPRRGSFEGKPRSKHDLRASSSCGKGLSRD